MPHKYLLLVGVVLAAVVSFHAQAAERVIGNDDVVKMHADGVSDAAIISKIRGSTTKFDMASATILALKDAGLSDAVLLAMVEAKPVIKFPLKDAVGTRRVFISTVDKASEMEIAKDMRDAGYEIVQRADEADLVMDFAIYKSTNPHNINDVGNHWARMIVSLRKNGTTGEIYRIDKKPDYFNSKNLNNQAKRFVRLFLEALAAEKR